jgi:predicted AAA+ superfamily ATPase
MHYARGFLFENFVLNELLKTRTNAIKNPNLYFWRNNKGVEIDCIIEQANRLIPVEIKSGQTYSKDFFKNINYWNGLASNPVENSYVVYGGQESKSVSSGKLLSWNALEVIPSD